LTPDSNRQTDFSEHTGEGLSLPPWEERERYGFFNAIYLTIRNALFSPRLFFARMPSRVGLPQPLLFAMIMGVIGAFFQWMWSLTGSSLLMFMRDDYPGFFRAPLFSGMIFAFSPLLMLFNVFIAAGLVHLCLMLVGGNKLGFEATFRVMAYTSATTIFLLVPFCGHVVIFFWGLTIAIIGIQRIHDIEDWRAVLAIVLPLLPCLFGWGSLLLLNLFGL
jgi:hypothetical protein